MDKGIIFFNRGNSCIPRAIVALHSLREHWAGPATMFLEKPYPDEFISVCKDLDVDVVEVESRPKVGNLARKNQILLQTPYEKTLWLDLDIIVCGSLDEMFESLDSNVFVIPHFCNWLSNGRRMLKRVKKCEPYVDPKIFSKAIQANPAINTGVFAYKRSKFLDDWVELSNRVDRKFFIADEISCQTLYPSYDKIAIADAKFNVSVVYGKDIEDKRIIHFHGKKHVGKQDPSDYSLSYVWVDLFEKLRENNMYNIDAFLEYSDKRLKRYLQNKDHPHLDNDVTIVTACDEQYVEILRQTFPNWRKYKKIDNFPVIIFVNGIELSDSRLDFLRLDNVKLIPWSESDLDGCDSHRELMLSAFVFGSAEHVQTPYWLKLDADSFATDYSPLFTEKMKEYGFCGHKWGYSKVEHIKQLDEWAKKHGRPKLKHAGPMIKEGRIDGKRFYHNKRRTISFIQLHTAKFTRFCVKLCDKKRLPAPTQDTFLFYVLDRFNPELIGTANFKKNHGFAQGNGRKGVDRIKKQLQDVDSKFS